MLVKARKNFFLPLWALSWFLNVILIQSFIMSNMVHRAFFPLCISLLVHQFVSFVHEITLLKGEKLPIKQLISLPPKDVKQTSVCNFHIIFINGASLFPLTFLTPLLGYALFAQFPHVGLLLFAQTSLHTHSFFPPPLIFQP